MVMSATEAVAERLSAYEAEQVHAIAAWKAQPPNAIAEAFKKVALPGARLVEKLIPEELVRRAIEGGYIVSETLAGQENVKRKAGVRALAVLRDRPLEECDRLAGGVSAVSLAFGFVEGALTGAGGVLTTALDIPLLFVLSLRTILRIGHCYGYTLDRQRDRPFVLGVLIAATSSSLEVRLERLDRLREIEEWLLEEAQVEIVAEEVFSLLFQLEVFGEIPGVGAVSGALLNLGFIRRVDLTSRRVFQERWLHDNGKVNVIALAPAPAHALARGWVGVGRRVTYSGVYAASFGVAFPYWLAASALGGGGRERVPARRALRRGRGSG
jgi:EcsC protein family